MAEQTKAVATQDMSTEVQIYEDRSVSDFNPNEHLIQIPSKDGKKDYLPVQWRLVWFRLMCPQGTIDTEELEVDNDRECEAEISAWNAETRRSEKVIKKALGYARYRAVVTDGKGGRASATKTERMVDFPDFVEKAETGAVGRALAMLGYGTQFAMIEFDEGERIVDAPVARPAKPYQERRAFVEADKPETSASAPITDQQKASIRKLYEHTGEAFVEDQVAAMTYQQAKDAIVDLSAKYNQMKGRTPAPVAEAPQPQTNGHQDATVAVTRGDLYTRGEEKGLWSRTSPDKFYAWASSISARPQSKTAWDMTIAEMGEMAKRIYAEPEVKKASAGAGK